MMKTVGAGTEFERMGDGHQAFAALAATLDGMPLMYSGQEEPLKKRLAFFEKDTIPFGTYSYEAFYTMLNTLKKRNKALWNGEHGGLSKRVNTHDHVYAFEREKDGDRFVGIFNLSNQPQTTSLNVSLDGLNEVDNAAPDNIKADHIELKPWDFLLFSNK